MTDNKAWQSLTSGPIAFTHAVLLLVEGDAYMAYEHLLELIPPQHQVAFLELLRAGVELRACFRELERFLAWERAIRPVLLQQGIAPESVPAQVTLYLLDQQHKADWPDDSA